MSNQSIGLSDALHAYLLDNASREPAVAAELRAETVARSDAHMQIAPEQGQFLALLWQLMGARRGIEIGVYTGYSALCSALALPSDGHLLACDSNPETAAIARTYWARAGVADRIDLRIASAANTLAAVTEAGAADTYDFAFIDADKEGYIDYYERCLALLRPGGLIAVDNTLWHGNVADASDDRAGTLAIRAFNEHVAGDVRVDLSLVPIGDGVTLARKR